MLPEQSTESHHHARKYVDDHFAEHENTQIPGYITNLHQELLTVQSRITARNDVIRSVALDAFPAAKSLAESLAYTLKDTAFTTQMRTAQEDDMPELVSAYLTQHGIQTQPQFELPELLKTAPLGPIMTAALDTLKSLDERHQNLLHQQSDDEMQELNLTLVTAYAYALHTHDMTYLTTVSGDSGASPAERIPEQLPTVSDAIIQTFELRTTAHMQPDVPHYILPESSEAESLPHTNPNMTAETPDVDVPIWDTFGLKAMSPDGDAIRSAVDRLSEKNPEILPPALRIMERIGIILRMNEEDLYIYLSDTFTDSRSWKSLARILTLRAFSPGMKHLPDFQSLKNHAQAIQHGTAHTLLPLSDTPHAPAENRKLPKEKHTTRKKDHFPETDSEILTCIQTIREELKRKAKSIGFSVHYPLGQGEFVKLDARLSIKHLDTYAKLVTAMEGTNGFPVYDELRIIKLVALKEYEMKFGMKEKKLEKALKRFDAVYSSL